MLTDKRVQVVGPVLEESEAYDFGKLYLAVRRRYRILAFSIGVCLVLALLYVVISPSEYTAEAVALMDRNQSTVAAEISSSAQRGFEASLVESQVEIIKSRSIALSVIGFIKPREYLEAVKNRDIEAQEEFIQNQIDNLQVRQIGETYVLAIRYTALDPVTSAEFANAYAEAYIKDQLMTGQEASAKGAGWLQLKISELREKAREASEKVNKFRKENNLYNANGQLINESQLTELNNRLGEARADTASNRAKYEYSKDVIETKNIDAATAEAFDNDVINSVRNEYLSSKKRYSELQRSLGNDHSAVKDLLDEIRDYENLIFSEMERVTQSQLSAYRVALAREKTLEEGLDKLLEVKTGNDSVLSELNSLEKEAETFAQLYESYLEKFEELAQNESFPISGSRVITYATPPLSKSHPKFILILAVAGVIGSALGFLSIIYLDVSDKTIRTGRHVNEKLGVSFIGYFPHVCYEENRRHPPLEKDHFQFRDAPQLEVLNNPFSVSAETLRKARTLIDKKKTRSSYVVGVISSVPDEGKTTVAINLALSLSRSGASCLLIDGDIRNPTIRQEGVKQEIKGLGDILSRNSGLFEALLKEEKTGLSILSSSGKSTEFTLDKINSAVIKKIISEYEKHFQYVVVDLPPINASSDSLCFLSSIDSYVLVAEWAQTKWTDLVYLLSSHELDYEKILGVVINKAELDQLKKFYGFKVYPEYTSASYGAS